MHAEALFSLLIISNAAVCLSSSLGALRITPELSALCCRERSTGSGADPGAWSPGRVADLNPDYSSGLFSYQRDYDFLGHEHGDQLPQGAPAERDALLHLPGKFSASLTICASFSCSCFVCSSCHFCAVLGKCSFRAFILAHLQVFALSAELLGVSYLTPSDSEGFLFVQDLHTLPLESFCICCCIKRDEDGSKCLKVKRNGLSHTQGTLTLTLQS